MLAPENVSVPDPVLVSAPLPLSTPLNVVLVPVSVVSVALPSVTLPAPASEPIVSPVLFKSSVAPLDTVTATVSAIALPPARRRVPALTDVAPV